MTDPKTPDTPAPDTEPAAVWPEPTPEPASVVRVRVVQPFTGIAGDGGFPSLRPGEAAVMTPDQYEAAQVVAQRHGLTLTTEDDS